MWKELEAEAQQLQAQATQGCAGCGKKIMTEGGPLPGCEIVEFVPVVLGQRPNKKVICYACRHSEAMLLRLQYDNHDRL